MAKRGGKGKGTELRFTSRADLGPKVRRLGLDSRPEGEDSRPLVVREPTVMQATWRDPDDSNPHRRSAAEIVAMRAADPLRVMHRRGGLVTLKHIAAAERLLDAFEVGAFGAGEGRGRPLVSAGGGGRAKDYPAERVLNALQEFRSAMACLSPVQARMIGHVVLGVPDPERRDVAAFAARHDLNEAFCRGLLVAALDALVQFYFPGANAEEMRAVLAEIIT